MNGCYRPRLFAVLHGQETNDSEPFLLLLLFTYHWGERNFQLFFWTRLWIMNGSSFFFFFFSNHLGGNLLLLISMKSKRKKIVVARFAPVIRTTCNVEKTLLNQMFAALFLFVSLSSTPTSLEIVYNFRWTFKKREILPQTQVRPFLSLPPSLMFLYYFGSSSIVFLSCVKFKKTLWWRSFWMG